MGQLSAYSLKSFYASRAGKIIARVIGQRVLEIWPDVKSKRLIGYGYALPYLNGYIGGEGIKDIEKSDVFNMMPQQLGVHHWPTHADNRVCLNVEEALPLETNSVDFVLMVHGLEFLDSPQDSFAEIWRVLKSTGRVLIVVPNRMGLWARSDWSPFGQGQPYSAKQVESFLNDNLFVHERTSQALFLPAFENRLLLRAANFFEKIGAYIYPALGGVHVIEASKQLYAGTGKAIKSSARGKAKKSLPVNAVPTQRIKN